MKPQNKKELLHGAAVLLMLLVAACSNLDECPYFAIAGVGIAITLYLVGERI